MMPELILRLARPEDVPTLFELIKALAEYEKLSDAVVGNPELLHEHLFGDRPYVEAILAELAGQVVGYALFFYSYSTFITKPGLFLEDLFVLPEYRGQGIGKSLLRELAKIALAKDCGRMEWTVLDWNAPAIAFYQQMGARILPEWQICRVTEEAIAKLVENN